MRYTDSLPITGAVQKYADARRASNIAQIVSVLKYDCRQLVAAQKEPPVRLDLRPVRQQQNISDIRQIKLAIDGRVFPSDDGRFVIEINAKSDPGRQNFTLAHEIGHTFFLLHEPKEKNRRTDKSIEVYDSENLEERLCDIAAAELLMPEAMFVHKAFDFGPSVTAIRKLCQVFRCSTMAVSRRYAEAGAWRTSIGYWRLNEQDDNSFIVEWSQTSRSAGLYLPKGTIAKGIPLLENTWTKGTLEQDYADFGYSGPKANREKKEYFTQALAYGSGRNKRIMTMTVFEPHPEQLANKYRIDRQTESYYQDNSYSQLDLPFDLK